jgi:hypothetical protein
MSVAAQQRGPGAVDAVDRDLTERDDDIGRDEDRNGRRSGEIEHAGNSEPAAA